jgi:hypothetical protein
MVFPGNGVEIYSQYKAYSPQILRIKQLQFSVYRGGVDHRLRGQGALHAREFYWRVCKGIACRARDRLPGLKEPTSSDHHSIRLFRRVKIS